MTTPTIQYTTPIGPKNDVLTQVRGWVERFVAFQNPAHPLILALWTLHTWTFDESYVTPYIYVTSSEPGCGKTTVAESLLEVARNGKLAGSLTGSVLFRTVDAESCTLFIDEADTIWSGAKNDDLRNVMNTGYKRNGTAMRVDGKEPREFSTFAPKLLAGIDNDQLPPTIADRTIKIVLRKVRKENLRIQRFHLRKIQAEAERMRNLLRDWSKDAEFVLALNGIDIPELEGVSDRQFDIAEPLLQIAKHFGIYDEAAQAIVDTFHGQKEETPETRVLLAAKALFEADPTRDRIRNTELAAATGYTESRVSRMISPMGIKSRPMKFGGDTERGYLRPEFEAAFASYL